MPAMPRDAPVPPGSRPWWRFGLVWFIVGVLVVAIGGGVATVYLAAQAPGPAGAATPSASGAAGDALEPAMQARNRASGDNARALGLDGK